MSLHPDTNSPPPPIDGEREPFRCPGCGWKFTTDYCPDCGIPHGYDPDADASAQRDRMTMGGGVQEPTDAPRLP